MALAGLVESPKCTPSLEKIIPAVWVNLRHRQQRLFRELAYRALPSEPPLGYQLYEAVHIESIPIVLHKENKKLLERLAPL